MGQGAESEDQLRQAPAAALRGREQGNALEARGEDPRLRRTKMGDSKPSGGSLNGNGLKWGASDKKYDSGFLKNRAVLIAGEGAFPASQGCKLQIAGFPSLLLAFTLLYHHGGGQRTSGRESCLSQPSDRQLP